ncbi:DVU_1551 family NTP transferase [Oryzibacter oryziterrae]|uniref:DVU_1551 family NTP transferase n=1 Tax=Oryzibacter oryziterrae TaxID=2766474 RepID=UPI001F3400C4|nr:NTP transferase domain-containing protein [Oryzibacter oryziterrae]
MPDRHAEPVAAVVLAAGLSSRMGAFKPLLPLGPGTTLAHVVGNLKQAGVRDIVVVTGHNAEATEAEAARLGVRAVRNPAYASGMFSSIKSGIAALAPDIAGCLLAPVDIPLVRPSTLARVLKAARLTRAPIVHPVFAGKAGHPPFIGRALFPEILAGTDRLCDILKAQDHAAQDVAVFDRACLADMDYPEDHARLAAWLPTRDHPDDGECEAMLDVASVAAEVRAHCRAVADLATAIATRLAGAGLPIDPSLARAGALVHDIAKGHPHHAELGGRLVHDFGFPAVAAVVTTHMAYRFTGTLDEGAIVYLADKLMRGTRRVSLADRFSPAFDRFAGDADALASAERRLAEADAIRRAVEAHGPLPDLDAPALPGAPAPITLGASLSP